KIARKVVVEGKSFSEEITSEKVTEYLGVPRFRNTMAEETNEIGIATGLAWTEVGGEILVTEATLMPGKGVLTLTGKLGDVMQESAQAAMSFVRSKAEEYGIAKDFNKRTDVHIHVPEGAIPKDGPSAGITLATALVSALARNPIRKDVAMTGEITLRATSLTRPTSPTRRVKIEASFIRSAASASDLPQDGLAEIALVGRSNVGKSSLINALVRQRVARTSAAPGKTRLANVYRVTRGGRAPLCVLDLPGYGYARAPKTAHGAMSAEAARRASQAEFEAIVRAVFDRAP